MFFSSQFDAVNYVLKNINENTDGELPFDIRADRYTATLETDDFIHWWYISNVTGQIKDLKK